jgi:hypothetical protein
MFSTSLEVVFVEGRLFALLPDGGRVEVREVSSSCTNS